MGLADFVKVHKFLRGIRYPATKQQLMDQARGNQADDEALSRAAGHARARVQRAGRGEQGIRRASARRADRSPEGDARDHRMIRASTPPMAARPRTIQVT